MGRRKCSGRKWLHVSASPTYFVWRNMRRRCRDPKDASYANYGGRGISVCPEWESYDQFYEDMGECPPGLTLDRIDVDGNYCKENCRWTTWKVQLNNQSRNVIVATGETLSMYCERTGEKYSRLAKRHSKYKMSGARLLTPYSLANLREVKHGTRSGYEVSKCRCALCRAANTKRHAVYMATRAVR